MDMSTLKSTISGNIQMTKTFSDGIIQKLPTGKEVLLTKDSLVALMQAESLDKLTNEETMTYV